MVRHGSDSAAFRAAHDARDSGSSLGAAPRSEFALQRQPSVRQATLEPLATPMPFLTGRFRACVSSSRAAFRSSRAGTYRGENPGPGKDDRGELDTETRN